MHPCGICGFNDRQSAYTGAILSVVIYCLQLIGVSLTLTLNFDTDLSEIQLYALLISTIISVFVSLLLFVGIRYASKFLILPWLVMTIMDDIGYVLAIIGYVFVISTTPYNMNHLLALVAVIFNFIIFTYLLWIIIIFFIDLFTPSGYGRRPSGSYNKFKNDEDIDSDFIANYPPPKSRNNSKNEQDKPTTVLSKLLPTLETETD